MTMQNTPGGTVTIARRDVARIGYGAMQLERLSHDPDAAASVLRHALDHGVDHIDTAEFYRNGFVNSVIRSVAGVRNDVFVATKIGATPNPGGPLPLRAAQRPEQLRASVEDNLRSLGTDILDLVYLRRMDVGPGLRPEGDQIVPMDDQLATLTALRDEGKIAALGISAVDADGVRHALPAGITAVQNAYSLVDRQFEGMLELCSAEGVAWVPYFPLGGAFPGLAKVTEQPAVLDAATRLGATPSQIGLAWLLQHSPDIALIPGTASIEHLDENLAVASIELDAETLATLDVLEPVGAGEIQWATEV
ncbi:aldo/keto reductase [Humibacter sp. RRB41]|uniref:aldo/keto reductase n=1 Tax=Humibacter sp. RRB41 TaxID=2919946 RepID=UPI001FA96E62|nr:aldo/keto reductase [Humibacter sp. RRB41]